MYEQMIIKYICCTKGNMYFKVNITPYGYKILILHSVNIEFKIDIYTPNAPSIKIMTHGYMYVKSPNYN